MRVCADERATSPVASGLRQTIARSARRRRAPSPLSPAALNELVAHGPAGEVVCSEHAVRRARQRLRLGARSDREVRAHVCAEVRAALRERRVSAAQPEWTLLPGRHVCQAGEPVRFAWDASARHVYCLLALDGGGWLVKTVLVPTREALREGKTTARTLRRRQRLALRAEYGP